MVSNSHGFIDPVRVSELAEAVTKLADWNDRQRAAKGWAAAWKHANVENTRETSLQGTFLHRVFVEVLGYVDQGLGHSLWTLCAEPTTDVNARRPDGSLGHYTAELAVTRVVIELKDALTDLDAKQMSRQDRLSPVEQAFLYLAGYEDAEFAIVSNFRQLRLYSKRYGMARYHEFDLRQLHKAEELSHLIGLCGASALVGTNPTAPPPLQASLSTTLPRRQQEITKEFYGFYAGRRDKLVNFIVDQYPSHSDDAIELAQKLRHAGELPALLLGGDRDR